jgi:hypothetical protein
MSVQFGGVVHNLDKLDPLFAEENQEMQDEAEAAAMHLKYDIPASDIVIETDALFYPNRTSAPLKRERLEQGGSMVKTTGIHSSMNQIYNATVLVSI